MQNPNQLGHPLPDFVRQLRSRLFRSFPPAGTASIGAIDRAGAARHLAPRHLHRDRARPIDHLGQGRDSTKPIAHAASTPPSSPRWIAAFATMGPRRRRSGRSFESYAAAVIASTWPDEPPPTGVKYPDTANMPVTGETPVLSNIINAIGLETRSLEPKDSLHQKLLVACIEQYRSSGAGPLEGDRGRATARSRRPSIGC